MSQIKTNLEKNLSELFDIPIEDDTVTHKVSEIKETGNLLDDDFERSRIGLESLLSTGQDALQYALSVAKQSDDPKAYSVVSGMIRNLADINEQLLELHLKHQRHKLNYAHAKKELNTIPEQTHPLLPNQHTPTQNTTIFVGSPAELAKAFRMNLGETIDATD